MVKMNIRMQKQGKLALGKGLEMMNTSAHGDTKGTSRNIV